MPFAQLQALVDHVWAAAGRRHPPRVRPLRPGSRVQARADRLRIEAPPALPSWVLLHEIAHALADPLEGDRSDGHGPRFLGLYLDLLERHLRLDRAALERGLHAAGLTFAAEPPST